jgi:predicted Zn-dependent protease
MRRTAVLLLSLLQAVAHAQTATDLPDIGNPAGTAISKGEEYRMGAMIVHQLRDENAIIDDPEVNEYLQSIGARIAAQTPDGGREFHFFAVRDNTINAFALPGGFIGVNYGTLLATSSESELASVMAHEIAHVTQRHIARTIRAQSKQSIASAAMLLAAILLGAMAGGGGDAMQGAIAIAQGASAQQQVNFTRANEYEADRVGISFMAAAGFNPQAMPKFFETMSRRTGLAGIYIPEMVQSHPVNSNRIAESRNRALQYDHVKVTESASYGLIRERLRVITAPRDTDVLREYRKGETGHEAELGSRYGEALALMSAGKPQDAARILDELVQQHEGLTLLYAALAQAEIAAGQTNDGMATFQHATTLFPRNVPIAVRYAEALMANGQAKDAHALLLDVFNNEAPTPEQIRLTALAASAAGDTGDAYYYMSEYHISSGDFPLAVQQLELALAAPNLTTVQRQRFQARLDEIREALIESRSKRGARREAPGQGAG